MRIFNRIKTLTNANRYRRKTGVRSRSETKVEGMIKSRFNIFPGQQIYESVTMPYEYVKYDVYRPDFIIEEKAMMLEVKGYFPSDVRTKMRIIKECYPDLDIRFVFDHPTNKIGGKSNTTYAEWAEKHGFPWCATKDFPPKEWEDHFPSDAQVEAFYKTLKLSEGLEVKRKTPKGVVQIKE